MRVACLWFDKPAPTAKLAELFLRFSPQICLRHDQAIFVEIGKCQALYSESSFINRAHVLLNRAGHSARIRVGRDVTEALSLARHGQARACADLPLDSLLDFVDPFYRDEFLRKSVRDLISNFQDLGVVTIGQLRQLPASQLIARFGVVGRHCYNRLHDQDFITWPAWTPEEVILEKKEFPYFEFYGELDPILFELKTQLDQIFARLFSRRRRLTRLQVQIRCERISTHPNFLRSFEFEFHAPQSSSKSTLRILKERLTREFEKNPLLSPIEAIQSRVLKAVNFEGGQKSLLNNNEEKFEQIHSLHNQLIEMLGTENIYQAVLTEDRRPERSWMKRTASPHEPAPAPEGLTERIPERTTYLCRYPVRILVMAGFIHLKNRRYRILHWDDQIEKISGGWYEHPDAAMPDSFDRTYHRVEIEGHQKISVFENTRREFFLHGYNG